MDNVAVDETVIRIDDQRFWLYAAVDPDINRPLHARLFSTRTTALTEVYLPEFGEKHLSEDVLVQVDGAS